MSPNDLDSDNVASPLDDAADLDTNARSARTRSAIPLTQIGLGKPLSVRIVSIFPGDQAYHRGRDNLGIGLVRSAVKNPLLNDASPMAANHYVRSVKPGSLLRPGADETGSEVIHYTSGLAQDSLDIAIHQDFDRFDRARWEAWLKVASKAAALPMFLVPGNQATGLAIVYAAESALKIALNITDRLVDGGSSWHSTWRLSLNEPGRTVAKAGYSLLYADDEADQPLVAGPDSVYFRRDYAGRSEQYFVSPDDGTLRYTKAPEKRVLEGPPYIVVLVNGASIPDLASWSSTAAGAVLVQRFTALNTESSAPSDVLSLLETYNDLLAVRQVASLDAQIKSAQGALRTSLTKKRAGALKNIQDETLKKMADNQTQT